MYNEYVCLYWATPFPQLWRCAGILIQVEQITTHLTTILINGLFRDDGLIICADPYHSLFDFIVAIVIIIFIVVVVIVVV